MNTYPTRAIYPGLDEYAKNVKKKHLDLDDLSPKQQELIVRRLRVGVRIRRERLLWGLTQEQLSTILGITPNYLGQIERGNRDLSRKMEEKVCQFFHMNRNELYDGSGNPHPSQVAEDNFLFPELNQVEIMRLLSSCNPEELALCGQILRYLLMCLRKSDTDGPLTDEELNALSAGTVS